MFLRFFNVDYYFIWSYNKIILPFTSIIKIVNFLKNLAKKNIKNVNKNNKLR